MHLYLMPKLETCPAEDRFSKNPVQMTAFEILVAWLKNLDLCVLPSIGWSKSLREVLGKMAPPAD